MDDPKFDWLYDSSIENESLIDPRDRKSLMQKANRFITNTFVVLLFLSSTIIAIKRLFRVSLYVFDIPLAYVSDLVLKACVLYGSSCLSVFVLKHLIPSGSSCPVLCSFSPYAVHLLWLYFFSAILEHDHESISSVFNKLFFVMLFFAIENVFFTLFRRRLFKAWHNKKAHELKFRSFFIAHLRKSVKGTPVDEWSSYVLDEEINPDEFEDITKIDETVDELKLLARDAYSYLRQASLVTRESLNQIFSAPEVVERVYKLFDVGPKGEIDSHTFRDSVLSLYTLKLALRRDCNGTRSLVATLKRVFDLAVVFILSFYVMSMFGLKITHIVLVVLSIALILNAALAALISEMVLAILHLLAHRYDTFDLVSFDNVQYTVLSAGTCSTTFKAESGGIACIPNGVLWRKSIVNLSREAKPILKMRVKVTSHGIKNKFKDLHKKISDFLSQNKHMYSTVFDIYTEEQLFTNTNALELTIMVNARPAKTRTRYFEQQSMLLVNVNEIIESLKIASN